VSDLGLVEMSRQRVRPSLYHFMSDKCTFCEATGHVLSLDSVANRIERMVRRVSHYTRARDVRLQANPHVAVFLREERYDRLQALMRATGVTIDVVDDARLHREDFRLMSVQTGEDLMKRVSGPGLAGPAMRPEEPEMRYRAPRGRYDRERSGAEVDGGRGGREPYAREAHARDSQSRDPRRDGGRDTRDSRDTRDNRSGGRDGRPDGRDRTASRERRDPREPRPEMRDRGDTRGFEAPRPVRESEAVEVRPADGTNERPDRGTDSRDRDRRRGRGGRGRRDGRPYDHRRPDRPESPAPQPVDVEAGLEPSGVTAGGPESGSDLQGGMNGGMRRKRRRGSRGRGRRGGAGNRPTLEDNPQARVTAFPAEPGGPGPAASPPPEGA